MFDKYFFFYKCKTCIVTAGLWQHYTNIVLSYFPYVSFSSGQLFMDAIYEFHLHIGPDCFFLLWPRYLHTHIHAKCITFGAKFISELEYFVWIHLGLVIWNTTSQAFKEVLLCSVMQHLQMFHLDLEHRASNINSTFIRLVFGLTVPLKICSGDLRQEQLPVGAKWGIKLPAKWLSASIVNSSVSLMLMCNRIFLQLYL